MESEITDNYLKPLSIRLVAIGEYGIKVAKLIKQKQISGLDCRESLTDIQDSDIFFVVASQDELESKADEIYTLTQNSELSYLYVKTGKSIEFCNSNQLEQLQKHFDLIIPIPNQENATESIYWSIRGITELLTLPSLIGIDFSDIQNITKNMGIGSTAFGHANGIDRVSTATLQAISAISSNGVDMERAKGVIVSTSAWMDIRPSDFDKVGDVVRNASSKDTHVLNGILGSFTSNNEIYVVITATGVCGI
jgi:hypothetical protein